MSINLQKYRIVKLLKKCTKFGISTLEEAYDDAIERHNMLHQIYIDKMEERLRQGLHPYPCYNIVCKNYLDDNSCARKLNCYNCLYQMLRVPPNSLDYNEYMPTHQEALDRLEANNLLSGKRDDYAKDSIYYGKAESSEERHQQDLAGINIEQLETAIKKVAAEFGIADASIIASNIAIECEKILGIYPNINLTITEPRIILVEDDK